MANLKEIRIRLGSVQSTRQITSAMKMVSAAKLRKAQDSIIQLRPYAFRLQEILAHLTASLEDDQENVYGSTRIVRKVMIIMISSNKGLCGAFNANVAKRTMQMMDTDYADLRGGNLIDVLAIGKKAADLLKNKAYPIFETQHELLDEMSYENIVKLAKRIMKAYASEEYDEVKIVYNQFKNAAVQDLQEEQYLPITAPKGEDEEEVLHETTRTNYILEPSRKAIIKELIPKMLKTQLYKAFLDSIASEHGARMTAMHKATDNASELIKSLQLEYNKARQASITTEILEIVSGANALQS